MSDSAAYTPDFARAVFNIWKDARLELQSCKLPLQEPMDASLWMKAFRDVGLEADETKLAGMLHAGEIAIKEEFLVYRKKQTKAHCQHVSSETTTAVTDDPYIVWHGEDCQGEELHQQDAIEVDWF